MNKPKVIGVTGGIGSGKSSIMRLFKEREIPVYYADIEAKILMQSNEKLMNQIKNEFGEEAYLDSKLNREYIANQVFNNKEKLKKLNSLVHPAVQNHFKEFLKSIDEPFVIYENAILFENGFDKQCDYIITVTASENQKIERVMKRDSLTEIQIRQRMSNQWSDEEKIKKSDFVIYNNEWEDTLVQFEVILNKIKEITKS